MISHDDGNFILYIRGARRIFWLRSNFYQWRRMNILLDTSWTNICFKRNFRTKSIVSCNFQFRIIGPAFLRLSRLDEAQFDNRISMNNLKYYLSYFRTYIFRGKGRSWVKYIVRIRSIRLPRYTNYLFPSLRSWNNFTWESFKCEDEIIFRDKSLMGRWLRTEPESAST